MAYYAVSLYYFEESLGTEWMQAASIAEALAQHFQKYPLDAERCETPHRKDEDVYPYSIRAKRLPDPLP